MVVVVVVAANFLASSVCTDFAAVRQMTLAYYRKVGPAPQTYLELNSPFLLSSQFSQPDWRLSPVALVEYSVVVGCSCVVAEAADLDTAIAAVVVAPQEGHSTVADFDYLPGFASATAAQCSSLESAMAPNLIAVKVAANVLECLVEVAK